MFRGDFGCFLYTGDFRWERDAAEDARTTLAGAINEFPVDILYLDNTYCNPIYSFPSRQAAAHLVRLSQLQHFLHIHIPPHPLPCLQVADIIASHPCHDIVIGIDSLGKEELLLLVSRILNIKVSSFVNLC